jgi:hypothetical protein
MTVVYLSPIGNGFNFATTGWLPLTEGKLYTYLAGTTTPQATYTTADADTQNANPIILGVDGRPPYEIWFVQGVRYKFLLTDSLDNPIQTYDDLTGINDTSFGDCCPKIGTATTANGQDFTATFPADINEWTDGLTLYVSFLANQTVNAPTLNPNGDATAKTIKAPAALGAIVSYRILTSDYLELVYSTSGDCLVALNLVPTETFAAAPDPTGSTLLTTGTKFVYNGFPGGTICGLPRVSLGTASSSGAVTLNVKLGGTTIFSTLPTIDQNETSSATAATPPVVSTRVLTDDGAITLTCDGAGSGAKGPVWQWEYRRLT